MFKQQSCLSSLTLLLVCQIQVREQTVSAARPLEHHLPSLPPPQKENEAVSPVLVLRSIQSHFLPSFSCPLIFLFFSNSIFSIAAGFSPVSPFLTQQPTQPDSILPSLLPYGKNLSSTLVSVPEKRIHTLLHLQVPENGI